MVINVSGWNDLISGNLFTSIVVMYQTYYGDWFFTILFLSFKGLLWFSTENLILQFMFSLIFLVLFGAYIAKTVVLSLATIATFELAGILYNIVFKK